MHKKGFQWFLIMVLVLVSVPFTAAVGTQKVEAANSVLWQLGQVNDSAAEFKDYWATTAEAVTIPTDWSTRTTWSFMSKGLKGDKNPTMNLTFSLGSVPVNGVELSFKVLDAYKITPQMGVFSNDMMAGLIQIAGVGGTTSPYPYKKVYCLYIPKELLQTGTNVLKLQTVRSLWSSTAEDAYLWWTWDYLKLEALGSPAVEPIHGRYTRLGTNIMQDDFYYNDNATLHLPYILKWMGIAYSGNINRFALWSDLGSQPEALGYLQTLSKYNIQAVADHLSTGTATVDSSGQLDAASKASLTSFFKTYGNLIQYYEIDNEPGLFNRSKAVDIAVAKYVNSIKPANVKTVAPGWAYWPTYAAAGECINQIAGKPKSCGDPDGWERDPVQRKQIEDLADLTSGHSYGVSNVDDQGGSFTENLETYGGSSDGLPKEMLVTETGSEDAHIDFPFVNSSQPHASVFDRILRGHVGFADHTLQHAAFFHESYTMFQTGFNWFTHDPATTVAYPGVSGEDSRLKSYRRLALAYATHGTPLPYTYTNKSVISGKKVYFRGVNAATLTPLPGSGGTSDKLLLNFINFETSPQTMSVRVTMPSTGLYEGERIGQGSTYKEAKTTVTGLNAQPTLDFSVTLAAGESVQYILTKQNTTSIPSAPQRLWLTSEPGKSLLSWSELDGAVTYNVKRSTVAGGSYTTLATGISGTSYTDTTVHSNTAYYYVVTATNAKGTGGDSPQAATAACYLPVMEAEDTLLGGGATVSNDAAASGGKKVGNMHYGGAFISANFDGGSGGTATIKVLYTKGDTGTTTKSLFVNGIDVKQLSFTNTGGWGKYTEYVTTVGLTKGVNTIMIKQDGGDSGGVDLDKLTVLANTSNTGGDQPNTTPPPITDTQAPTTPTNLAGTTTETTAVLTWNPSTDNVGIAGYDIYRGTEWIKSVIKTETTYTDNGLAANTAYSYTVLARDEAGNASSTSAPVTVKTLAPLVPQLTSQVAFKFALTGAGAWTPIDGVWSVGAGGDYSVTNSVYNKSMIKDAVFTDGGIVLDLTVGTGGTAGVLFRASNVGTGSLAFNGYFVGVSKTGSVVLGRAKDKVWTELGTAVVGVSGWYHVKVDANGSQIKVYVGNMTTPVITVTDSTFVTGGMGLRTINSGGAFNNFYAGPPK